MPDREAEYLTTREVAELLRIKERKVYALASSGEIPCSRAMGKLLFPREAVDAWLRGTRPAASPSKVAERPNVLLGSYEPLLEWALRESRCGLATFLDGSLDGLERFARGEGVATGLHLFDPVSGEWNLPAVRARFADRPVVLVEWCWRERGLIVPPGEGGRLSGLADLTGRRFAPRQTEAGSQRLFEHLLERDGVDTSKIEFQPPSRSERDAVLEVAEGRAEATFGLAALARQYQLDFVPLTRERFDLLVERRAWFETPFQALLNFCRSGAFADRVSRLEGYDFVDTGRVHFNGP